MKNKMKFLVMAFVAATVVFTTSCKKEEAPKKKEEVSIIGVWELHSAKATVLGMTRDLDIATLNKLGIAASIEFSNDTDCAVKIKFRDKNHDVKGKWKKDGDNIKLSLSEIIEMLSKTNKEVTLTKDGEFYTTEMTMPNPITGDGMVTAVAKFKKK